MILTFLLRPSPRMSHGGVDDEGSSSSTPVLRSKPTFESQQSASAASSSQLQGGAPDMRKLLLENKKLKDQLKDANERGEEKSKKMAALQLKVKQLEKLVPKSAMKDLRKDGYQREPTSESDTVAALSDSGVADTILASVRGVLEDSDQPSFQTISYWLSWAINLHSVVSLQQGNKSSILESGIETKRTASLATAGERGTMRNFLFNLERIIEDAYKLSHRVVVQEIEALVKRKVRSYWDVEVESSAVGQDMVDLFERWFVFMVNCDVPRCVINEWVYQGLHSLNSIIFNSFLENPRLCEAAVALQLKFYVSELENWGSQHSNVLYHWRSFRSQLQPLVDLTNLMLLDKAQIAVSMLREGAPSLSILQVKFLLDVYSDSKDSSERVPRPVLKEISDAANMDVLQKVSPDKAMLKVEKWFNLSDLTSGK